MKEVKNIFVVSTIGQLKQVNNLIKDEKIKDNLLAVVSYENNNLQEKILANVEIPFIEIIKLETIQDFNIKNQVKFYDSIEKILENNSGIENIFLCSFELQYNYFKVLADSKKIKLNLIEEGIGTYKKIVIKKSKIKKIFKKIKKEILPKKINSYVDEIEKFEKGYLAFPKLGEKCFSFKELKHLKQNSLKENESNNILKDEQLSLLDENSIIFSNQNFGFDFKEHIDTIFEIFKKNYPNKKIFFKFHPRDTEEIREYTKTRCDKESINTLELKNEVPLENILESKKIGKVVGISSSTLFYAKEINSEIEVETIGYEYQKRISKKLNFKQKKYLKYNLLFLNLLDEILEAKND